MQPKLLLVLLKRSSLLSRTRTASPWWKAFCLCRRRCRARCRVARRDCARCRNVGKWSLRSARFRSDDSAKKTSFYFSHLAVWENALAKKFGRFLIDTFDLSDVLKICSYYQVTKTNLLIYCKEKTENKRRRGRGRPIFTITNQTWKLTLISGRESSSRTAWSFPDRME